MSSSEQDKTLSLRIKISLRLSHLCFCLDLSENLRTLYSDIHLLLTSSRGL